jgi:hypothetical protein
MCTMFDQMTADSTTIFKIYSPLFH